MINYLLLPLIALLGALLSYVLAQDTRTATNRLFVLYAGLAILQDGISLTRLTTVDAQLAYFTALMLAPLLAVNSLLLVWLVLALFLPQRYAQPIVRWLIGLPYIAALTFVLLESFRGQPFWIASVERAADSTFTLRIADSFNPLLAALIIGQIVAQVMLASIALRHPDRRRPAAVLLGGMAFSLLISSLPQTRSLQILYSLSALPLYLAFAWVTLRYQLFRPSVVALQTAIESLPDGLVFLDRQRQVRYTNRAARSLLAITDGQLGQSLETVLDEAALRVEQRAQERSGEHIRLARTNPSDQIIEGIEVAVLNDHSAARILVLRDITDREQQNAALRTQNEEQGRLLDLVATLETPSVALADGVLLAPIVGHLDTRRAQRLMAQLLQDVHSRRTSLVILDITGVPVVDSGVAMALLATTQALRLLGCRVAISGIGASTATILVQQGVSLEGVTVARSAQEALVTHAASGLSLRTASKN